MRLLVPYYFISTHPVGWRCSDCGKIFRVPINVLQQPTSKPADDVQARFEAHSCLQYLDELEARRNEQAAARSVKPTAKRAQDE